VERVEIIIRLDSKTTISMLIKDLGEKAVMGKGGTVAVYYS
jgi:hypothetical protein